jgi:hypothetical protein
MSRARRPLRFVAVLAVVVAAAAPRAQAQDAMLARIRDEGMNKSQVLSLFDHLTNVIGPRLTGTPAFKASIDWTAQKFKEYGLTGITVESWPFGAGWTLEAQTSEMIAPRYMPLLAYAEAWSPSMPQAVTGAPVYIGDLANVEAVRALGDKVRGAIVLPVKPMEEFITENRLNPTEHDAPVPIGQPRPKQPTGPAARNVLMPLLKQMGAAAVLRPTEGNDGTLFVLGSRTSTAENSVPSLILSSEQYNMIVRGLRQNVPVQLRVNVQTRYHTADTNGYNVIAEIKGTDPRIGDEVVLLGAHIDSWHSATGATDNADAVVEVMEAMRILKAVGIRPRRTIRAAIWGGEEQGLLGSRAYAQRHYAGDANAAAREKFSVYFNNDPGTGAIYGWYAEGNTAAKSILDAWLAPLTDVGARRNVIEKIGNTDHLAFTALGLPAFNSVQDYRDYDTRIHHTNWDFFERADPLTLRQASVVLATFAYQAAMRDERFPRQP